MVQAGRPMKFAYVVVTRQAQTGRPCTLPTVQGTAEHHQQALPCRSNTLLFACLAPSPSTQLCARRTRVGLRGTSPLRGNGRERVSDDDLPRETLLRRQHRGSKPATTDGRAPNGVRERPWTTGEFGGNYGVPADGVDAEILPNRENILLERRARSAGDAFLPPSLLTPDLNVKTPTKHDLEERQMEVCDGKRGSTAGTSVSCQAVRRVSFADDEEAHFAAAVDRANPSHEYQLQRSASLTDDSRYGGRSKNPETTEDSGGNRRKIEADRKRFAAELVRVAHELMFADTRPDGLRPITGTPMEDGGALEGGGGALFVGLAGLQGFDLSFVAPASSRPCSGKEVSSPFDGQTASEPPSVAVDATTDSRLVRAASTSSVSPPTLDACWLASGSLLDRKPGSLTPGGDRSGTPAPDGGTVKAENVQSRQRSPSSDEFTRTAEVASPTEKSKSHRGEEERVEAQLVVGVDSSHDQPDETGWTANEKSPLSAATDLPATGVASLFSPKAAALWTVANVGMDDLVAASNKRHGHEVWMTYHHCVYLRCEHEERMALF